MEKGFTHLYFGNGKGKTTMAMGLSLRALGNGLRVEIYQFLKGVPSGERVALKQFPNASVFCPEGACEGFLWNMDGAQRERFLAAQRELLGRAADAVRSGQADLIVLDEALRLPDVGAVSWEEISRLMDTKSDQTELVLTGGSCPDTLIRKADYATELIKRAHPYDRGEIARRGIEY